MIFWKSSSASSSSESWIAVFVPMVAQWSRSIGGHDVSTYDVFKISNPDDESVTKYNKLGRGVPSGLRPARAT